MKHSQTRWLSLFIFCSVSLTGRVGFNVSNSFAQDTKEIHSITIQQNRYKANGILVSQPNSLDIKILNTLNRYKIHSLKTYAQWIKENVQYKSDGSTDIWASPEETLHKRTGDCEDYAFLNAAVLHVLGYKPRVVAVVQGRNLHAICVFQKNGYYLWFDNGQLKQSSTKTISEFAKYIFSNYNSHFLLEHNPKASKVNNWQILFRES